MIRFCFPGVELAGSQNGEAGVGGHGQGHVAVTAGIAADLVVVQPAFLLRGLEALLDGPPGAGNSNQLVKGRVSGAGGDVVGDLLGSVDTAAGDHPVSASAALTARLDFIRASNRVAHDAAGAHVLDGTRIPLALAGCVLGDVREP